jgi:hypothetical protein
MVAALPKPPVLPFMRCPLKFVREQFFLAAAAKSEHPDAAAHVMVPTVPTFVADEQFSSRKTFSIYSDEIARRCHDSEVQISEAEKETDSAPSDIEVEVGSASKTGTPVSETMKQATNHIADQSEIATSKVRSERAAQSKPQAVRLQLSRIR